MASPSSSESESESEVEVDFTDFLVEGVGRDSEVRLYPVRRIGHRLCGDSVMRSLKES